MGTHLGRTQARPESTWETPRNARTTSSSGYRYRLRASGMFAAPHDERNTPHTHPTHPSPHPCPCAGDEAARTATSASRVPSPTPHTHSPFPPVLSLHTGHTRIHLVVNPAVHALVHTHATSPRHTPRTYTTHPLFHTLSIPCVVPSVRCHVGQVIGSSSFTN